MNISQFLTKLNIPFKDPNWYQTALTHRSYMQENANNESYDKLEFFGDSIINFFVAEFLFQQKLKDSQIMSFRKNFLISNLVLAKVAKKLNFFSLIKVGKNMPKNKISEGILADCFEAFIGALYLDLENLDFVRKFLQIHLINANWEEATDWIDYKTTLQEFVQKKMKTLPNLYKTEKINGIYHVNCSFDKWTVHVTDLNKKVATKKAAKLILQKLKIIS